MRIVITGGSGFVGGALATALVGRGDEVTVLSRNPARVRKDVPARVQLASWDPSALGGWTEHLAGADAVVHLAGAPVAARWTTAYKRRIDSSRATTTELLVEAIGKLRADAEREGRGPTVLVSASAIGYYGSHRPGEKVSEDSSQGSDFLAGVCGRWEKAARRVEEHGVRSVQLRFGVVLGAGGGALSAMRLPLGVGVAGPLGDNLISWVHIDDVVAMVLFALDDEQLSGPLNVVAPNPATAAQLARTMGRVLARPVMAVPAAALRLRFGQGAEPILGSLQVEPKRVRELGYRFRFPDLEPALASACEAD